MKQSKVTVQPTSEPVTLQEVKDFLKITTDDQDDYLTGLISASRKAIEEYLHIAILTQTRQVTINTFYFDRYKEFIKPVQSIVSITIYDTNNNPTVWPVDNYYLVDNVLLFKDAAQITNARYQQGIEIVYVCGYGDAVDDLDDADKFAFKNGILQFIKTIYKNCDAMGGQMIIPAKVKQLLSSYMSYSTWRA